MSLSSLRYPLPEDLQTWLARRPNLPPHAARIHERYPNEPYRLILSLLANDLAEASQDDMKSRLLTRTPHTARIQLEDLTEPLEKIANAIPQVIAKGPLETTLRQLEIFGLHGARLDIREESSRLNASLGEILRGLGLEPNFEEMEAADRQDLLVRLLHRPGSPSGRTYRRHPRSC